MNNYAYLIKAKAKANEAKSLFCWFSAKSDSRADRRILDILEDADIETGRGADHQLPLRTNWLIVDDLPEEGVLDDTWCDRYELQDDQRTWLPKAAPASDTTTSKAGASDDVVRVENGLTIYKNDDEETHYPVSKMPFRKQLLSQFTTDELRHHITRGEHAEIAALEMDTDNSYVQNLLLAAENCDELKKFDTANLWRYTAAIKKVFAQDKRHELSLVLQFSKTWLATEYIDRGILVCEWAKGNRITSVQRTDGGANAGGGNATDRNPELIHTFESLDIEIALATLPMDFNIYDLPGSVYRRAKEIVKNKEKPFAIWSAALRSTPGILDYSRAAVFALIRSAAADVHHFPQSLRTYISANLAESDHANPTAETLVAARHTPEKDDVEEVLRLESEAASANEEQKSENQPQIDKIADGVFSIEGLISGTPSTADSNAAEFTSNEPMEETGDDEAKDAPEMQESEEAINPVESRAEASDKTDALNNDSGHHNDEPGEQIYTHLMADIETMGEKADAPIVSIGAVFFNPETGQIGPDFYKVISLESSMNWGGKPDASTIVWWLKQSPEARAAIAMDDTIPLDDALLQLNDFISENAVSGAGTVEVWGNGATFDNVILRSSYERTGIDCPWKTTNDRDVRTIVTLGKAVGCNPRYKIPFEGDQHNALADAVHQAKYVSVIWQRLTAN